jgi:hypothetical protein
MLQTLLWSCPICKTQDSLTHLERRFRHDQINCTACQSQWDLIRVVGGPDFRLRLISGDNVNQEKPLAEWYDQMLGNLVLEPIEHPSWPLAGVSRSDELLYLHSPILMGLASPDEPVFQQPGWNLPPGDNIPMGLRPLGPGQLFFTSQRLIFSFVKDSIISLSWSDLRSVDTLMDIIFNVRIEDRMYGFVLKGQSVLKWLAHTRLLIKQNEYETEHRIYQGYM